MFNKRERNGILVLLIAIVALIIYLWLDIAPNHEVQEDTADPIAIGFKKELEALENKDSGIKSYNNSRKWTEKERETSLIEHALHPFNPNLITDENWKQLGIEDWQVKAIKKYKEKAGDFKTKEDFKKVKVITQEQFDRLAPYFLFNDSNEHRNGNGIKTKMEAKPLEIIELNSANENELMLLKGIGAVFSTRIMKYRDLLGGFINKIQLLEVFGVDSALYSKIEEKIRVDSAKVVPLNINKVAISRLNKHPYISWNVANAIVNYRDQHGPYQHIDEIKNTDLIDAELYEKIKSYLSLK